MVPWWLHSVPGNIKALSKPIRMQCESPHQLFCLCYPLFC
ncbi:hypothetical protein E2C01_023524 [Portunus trituberculatus]|uniref:Uncharacterized protein n=1 Tax=Portunus trituberculatus TaxID=210409 RepID=A0A5B7EBC5_PORTR|nr:hypothetical protein [Portunus trituberculatus]